MLRLGKILMEEAINAAACFAERLCLLVNSDFSEMSGSPSLGMK